MAHRARRTSSVYMPAFTPAARLSRIHGHPGQIDVRPWRIDGLASGPDRPASTANGLASATDRLASGAYASLLTTKAPVIWTLSRQSGRCCEIQ